jgi:hypothetical protein
MKVKVFIPKRQLTSKALHGSISHKGDVFITTTTPTPNSALQTLISFIGAIPVTGLGGL